MAKRSAGTRRGNPSDITTPIFTSRIGGRGRSSSAGLSWQFPLTVGGIHWLIVTLASALAFKYGTLNSSSPPYRTEPPYLDGWIGTIVNPMRQWDGLWYRLVAVQDYDERTPHKAAFWPLFPWLMRAMHKLFGLSYETAGYLISNISFLIALVLLYQLLTLDFEMRAAKTALWALALFPTAFFFNAVYTESLFLALMVGALLAARLQHWWLAGLVGALAATTRSYGMFLVLPFAVLLWNEYGDRLRRQPSRLIPVGLPLLGPALFSWWLERKQDDWEAWRTVQYAWNRYTAAPWETLRWAFTDHSPENIRRGINASDGATWSWLRQFWDDPSWDLITSNAWRLNVADSDTLELVCTLLFIVLAIAGLKVLPLYQTAYLIPGLIVPLFQPSSVHTLMSMPRFGLTLFPLFVVIGILLASKRIAPPLAIASAALLVLLTIQFSTWYWVS